MDFPIARQLFYQAINQTDPSIDLERAALYVAMEEYPDLEVDEYINALDVMAEEVQERLPTEFYPLKVLRTLNHYLYDELGFVGNEIEYYDPRNSFLNDVLERRTGIPITLSLVYLAISRRINFPMVGIGMPGHFLIRPVVSDMELFVDAFHQGEILFLQDCADRLNQVFGQPVEMKPVFLEPVSDRQFLARMLTNLKVVYIKQNDLKRALAAIERILLLFPYAPIELRDRGILYYRQARYTEARQDLEDYLNLRPQADDAGAIKKLLDTMNSSP